MGSNNSSTKHKAPPGILRSVTNTKQGILNDKNNITMVTTQITSTGNSTDSISMMIDKQKTENHRPLVRFAGVDI